MDFLSRWTFAWATPFVRQQADDNALRVEDLSPSDLWPLPRELEAARPVWDRSSTSLAAKLRELHGRDFWRPGLRFKLPSELLSFLSPLLLHALAAHLGDDASATTTGLLLAVAFGLVTTLRGLLYTRFEADLAAVQHALRGNLYAAVARKSLQLSCHARQSRTVGDATSLLVNDTRVIVKALPFGHMLWSVPLSLVVVIGMLFSFVGSAVLAGIAVLVVACSLNGIAIKVFARLQKRILELQDERLKVVSEALHTNRLIKFCNWQAKFIELIDACRGREVAVLRLSMTCSAGMEIFFFSLPALATVAILHMHVHNGGVLSPEIVFPVLACLHLLRAQLAMLPWFISGVASAYVSVRRLTDFLSLDNAREDPVGRTVDNAAVRVTNATFGYRKNPESTDDESAGTSVRDHLLADADERVTVVLNNVSFTIERGELVAVVGAVGSGKSTLLNALVGLGEKLGGDVCVAGAVGYMPEDDWIRNASVRDNITVHRPADDVALRAAMHDAALEPDLDAFPAGDQTEVGENGVTLSGGQRQRLSLARCLYGSPELLILDAPLSSVDGMVAEHIVEHALCGPRHAAAARIVATHNEALIRRADRILLVADGHVRQVSLSEIEGTHVHLTAKDGASSAAAAGETESAAELSAASKDDGRIVAEEEREHGNVKLAVYRDYARLFGLLPVVGTMVGILGNEIALRWGEFTVASVGTPASLDLYGLLALASAVFVLLTTIAFAFGNIRASTRLHRTMVEAVLRAPAYFLDVTPLGRVLNRFGSDLNSLDDDVCFAGRDTLVVTVFLLGAATVVVIASPAALLLLPPCGLLYFRTVTAFNAASRDVRRLQSTTQSPVLGVFGELFHPSGAGVLRSLGVVSEALDNLWQRVVDNQRACMAGEMLGCWMSSRVHLIGSLLVGLVAISAVLMRGFVSSSLLTMAIMSAASLADELCYACNVVTRFLINMVSVERLFEFARIEPEKQTVAAEAKLAPSWPSQGTIEFDNLSAKHRPDLAPSLHNVSLTIPAGAKVGICGRSGSGKSSLVAALFRLMIATDGHVRLDGVDTAAVPLDRLRAAITCVPQQPQLFSGTVRSNLDPFDEFSTAALLRVLDQAGLALELDDAIVDGGSNISLGQQQLMCLARGILRNSAVLVLDESTASLDLESDARIQSMLDASPATRIVVAHRLDSIQNSDLIVVMDNGSIKEVGPPATLLANSTSAFSSLLRAHKR